MKKLLSILIGVSMVLVLVACGNSNNIDSKNAQSKSSDKKVYKAGEEAFILDDSGNKIYSLKINSVKIANDFEYKKDFPESNLTQIVEVDYSYSNIAKNDKKLLIHGADLQVVDLNGTVAEASSMFPKQKPKEITVGTNCTVQSYYGLVNKSDTVKIVFTSGQYKKNGAITFEIPVS